jgi:GAF domain-containing protein
MFRLFFPLPSGTNRLKRWRVIAIYIGVVFFVLSRIPLALPDVLDHTADLLGYNTTLLLAVNGVFLLLILFAWTEARREHVVIAATALIAVLLVEGALYVLLGTWDFMQGWIRLWLVVVLGAFLFNHRISLGVVSLLLVVMTLAHFGDIGDLDRNGQYWRTAIYLTQVIGVLSIAGLMGQATILFQRSAQSVVPSDAQILIELGSEVARNLFERHDLDDFLKHFTEQVVEYFPTIYHAEVYHIRPESQVATLRASTGTVGQQLLAQEHELEVGGLSLVGRATLTQNELVIQDYTRGTPLKPNPLLPQTRAEFALPLVVNEQVIGALDVQSNQADAFTPDDLVLLRAIGTQLGIALDGLLLYEEAQRSSRENQALYQQTQANLREIERLNYQLTGRAWSDYLRVQPDATALTLDLESGEVSNEAEWTPTLNEAAQHHQVITITKEGQRVLSLPIIVRNEAVGAMEFEIKSEDPLPDEIFELAQDVGQRLGLALENRRLFDETQRVAQREALINDIGAELQTATGVDTIIQQTARRLQEALATERITIRLGKTEVDQPDQKGHT